MTKSISKAWSAELTETVVAAYVASGKDASALPEIAKSAGKTVPAVRSKLVAEGVYQKAAPRTVGGASTVRKASIVKQIAEALHTSESLESLEKASKADLEAVLAAITSED